MMTDYAAARLKPYKAAQYIRELSWAASQGDKEALEFVFNQAGRLAFTCSHLASDPIHTAEIRKIVENFPWIAVPHSQIESWDNAHKMAFRKFNVGKKRPVIICGRWDHRNPASRSIVTGVMIMASIRLRAKEKPQSQWTEVERICGNLPSTRTKAHRLKACKAWRDAFIQFSKAWHQAGLCEDITTWPEFKHYLDRRGNRSSSPSVAGISEMILEFLKRHLKI
jgi:hypothetical protein